MIEGFNITSGYYKAVYQSGAPVSDVETTDVRPVQKPTRVNDISAKDDKNRMGAELELSEEEQKYLEELKKRDREVREHEMAHKRAAGQYAGPVSYTYQTGPDNKQYAIGGKTQLDTSEDPEPEKNVEKQEVLYDAALAPKEPSRKDKEVAAEAQQSERESRVELEREKQAEREEELKAEEADGSDQSAGPSITEYGPNGRPFQDGIEGQLSLTV